MTQQTSSSTGGAIATPHASATEVGAQVLRNGGNAIDAALAAAVALCVVYPNNVALGSDLVALVHTPDGRVHEINATGGAPSGTSLQQLRERYGDVLPMYGIDTINLPGAVRGLERMHALGGALPWRELLRPSVDLARDGVPMPSSVAKGIRSLESLLRADPGCAGVFFREGEPIAEGEPFRQPALAETLERLADAGPDEFYTGRSGAAWLAALNAMGSGLTAEDLQSFEPEVGAPLRLDVEGFSFISSNPNTQGFALLRALRAAGGFDGGIDPVPLATAFLDANAVRDQYLADPRFGGLSGAELLAIAPPEHIDAPYRGRPMGDTVGIAVASGDGYAVSLIQSVYFQFGSAVLDPGTGILFQNRGTSFSLDAEAANSYRPGKRPSHTLMPVLIQQDGRLRFVSATMGGQGQPQIHAQLFSAAMEGRGLDEVVAGPRWLVGRQTPSDGRDTVTAEADLDDRVVQRFVEAGLRPKRVAELSDVVGHANLIEIDADSTMAAASDPRSDGAAVVISAAPTRPEQKAPGN
ncbi:gamma-glutamyltransferase [Leucobacter sp. CSA1]|uniref:Gamma-glutamyltransferase n=1 Tax=Leucobacter chromiisoli TaxID=2796471 RepID=A0A934UV71_9MICO|nr:gamma-glutamyltransferase [Leucobacter chromiisoli]MBK0418923.1 gamma-glutamyltransferase [Leucobacter chromiisoli]